MGNIEIFNSIANQYDTPDRIKIAKIAAKELRKYIINGKVKTAIDYGCGTGLVGMELMDEFNSLSFIDASSSMINIVEQKIETLRISSAKALCLDAESTGQLNLQTDYIFLVQVLLHVKDIEPFLANLYKLLNNNGHLLIVDFDYNESVVSEHVHSGFKQQQLIQILEKTGFVDLSAKTFYHGNNIFMNSNASLFVLDAAKTNQ